MRPRSNAFSGLRQAVAVAVAVMTLVPLVEAKAASAADEISWMFDPDAVVEINLGGLSEEELDALEAEPDEYQEGTFELKVNGVPKGPALAEVGIRRKGGFGSSRPIKTGKSGLKLRFDEFVDDQLFFGIKRLTLNNMFQDESMVHETLTYELFHALELPASRTGYAFVNLNGAKYGLFLNVETLDEVTLPQWFPTTGHLYEADASGTDVRPGEAETFEVDEGDDEDLSDLEALIAAANDAEGDWSDGMAAVADLERMTAQWAVERYVGHWDGYAGAPEPTPDPEDPIRPNNYYLHSDEAGIFQLMPWGTDQTWEFPRGFGATAGGLMFNHCIADESCWELYLDGLTAIHCMNQDLDQTAHATQLAAMLDPYQDEEDETRRGYSAVQIADEVENTEGFAEARAAELEERLIDEERLGGDVDPCADPEQPDSGEDDSDRELAATTSPGSEEGGIEAPAGLRSLRVASDGTLVVVLGVGRAGTARLTGAIETRRGRRQVCVATGKAKGPRKLTLRCRLSDSARARLRKRRLNVHLAIEFEPTDGSAGVKITRSRAVPRLPHD